MQQTVQKLPAFQSKLEKALDIYSSRSSRMHLVFASLMSLTSSCLWIPLDKLMQVKTRVVSRALDTITSRLFRRGNHATFLSHLVHITSVHSHLEYFSWHRVQILWIMQYAGLLLAFVYHFLDVHGHLDQELLEKRFKISVGFKILSPYNSVFPLSFILILKWWMSVTHFEVVEKALVWIQFADILSSGIRMWICASLNTLYFLETDLRSFGNGENDKNTPHMSKVRGSV